MKRKILYGSLLFIFLLAVTLQFTPPEFIYKHFVLPRAHADITDLEGITGKVGQEDISWGNGLDTDTFTVATYTGGTVTLTKVPSLFANAYSIIKGKWYVTASSGDHGNASVAGTLAWAVSTIGASNQNIELCGNQTYTISTNLSIPANITLAIQRGAILSPANARTLTFSGTASINAGNYQIFAGDGSFVFATGQKIKSSWFATLNTAITKIAAVVVDLEVLGTNTLTAQLTFPATMNVRVPRGSNITKASTYTAIVNGGFEAGDYPVWVGFTAGDVTYGSTSITTVNPAWWALTDVGLQCAIDSITGGGVRKTVQLRNDCNISATVVVKEYVTLDCVAGARIIPAANVDLIEFEPRARARNLEFYWVGDATFDSACILFEGAFTAVEAGRNTPFIDSIYAQGDETGAAIRGQLIKFNFANASDCMDMLRINSIVAHHVNTIFYNVMSNAAGNTWNNGGLYLSIITSDCSYIWRDALSGAGTKRIYGNYFNISYEGGSAYVPADYVMNFDQANLDQLRMNTFIVFACDMHSGGAGSFFNGKAGEKNTAIYAITPGDHVGTLEGTLIDSTQGVIYSTPIIDTGPRTGLSYYNNMFLYDDGTWNINETGKALLYRQDAYWRKVKFEGKAVYDFATAATGGDVGTHALLGSIPDNVTITRAWYEVITPFASGGAATVSLGVVTDGPAEIQAVTAFNDAVYLAGWHDGLPDGTAANFTTKTTAIRNLCLVVATAPITAGKIWIYFDYVVTE